MKITLRSLTTTLLLSLLLVASANGIADEKMLKETDVQEMAVNLARQTIEGGCKLMKTDELKALIDSAPRVYPVFFVHHIEGVDAGIYCLARDPSQLALLRGEMRPDWLWAPVRDCSKHLPLYLLAPMDVQAFAVRVSCNQEIAGDSAFSLAMLADFDDITTGTPWPYRQHFWEAGTLGQVLYLEAEAAGAQGTGIGCYFDDAVHQALGLKNQRLQDIYHFTVGTAEIDRRLVTTAPYAHLSQRLLPGLGASATG